jgi:hypothetical protein
MYTGGVTGQTNLIQQLRLVLEPTLGEQLLMPQTAGAATLSLTTQPNTLSPTTGMSLHFYIIGNTASGTIVVAGTNPAGGSITSQTYHINPAPQNAQGFSECTTKEVFATVSSGGISLAGGLASGCQIIVWGSCAGKLLIPIEGDAEEKIALFSPPDKRGILWKNTRVSALTKATDVGKLDAAWYPDSLWALYMLFGNSPNITTVPSSAPSLLAATAKATSMTLTTAPTAPGMFLIFTLASNSVAGTITLSGLDNYGYTASETINVSASQTTAYSTRRYSSLTSPGANQFATTGLSVGATIAVSGAFAWNFSWTYDGVNNYTPYSACLEFFDGVMGKKLPGTILTDGQWDWQKQKNIAFTSKGSSQDYLVVGDPNPTTYPSGVNPFATLAQPTSVPVVSWPSSWYLDPGTGVPFTTQDGSLLTFKFGYTSGRKYVYTGDGMQRPSFVTWEAAPDISLDATLIMQNYASYVSFFKQTQAMILGANFQGNLLGSIGGTTYYENMQWIVPAKIDTDHVDASKAPVELAIKFMPEYSFVNLGYAFKVSVVSQTPPTYVQ